MENKSDKTNNDDMSSVFSRPNLILVNLAILVVFLLIVAGVYVWIVKKNKGQVVFPAGINYLSPKTQEQTTPKTTFDFAKMAAAADWATYKGKVFAYSFQHPKDLLPLTFPNDQSDSVTFKVSDVPPELNIMFLVETISSRDKNLVGKPEEFATSYWKFFSGLKGLNNVSKITNEKGLVGYKATYIANSGVVTSENYFFTIEGDNDHMLHIANIFPNEGKGLFNRIINSIEYKK